MTSLLLGICVNKFTVSKCTEVLQLYSLEIKSNPQTHYSARNGNGGEKQFDFELIYIIFGTVEN